MRACNPHCVSDNGSTGRNFDIDGPGFLLISCTILIVLHCPAVVGLVSSLVNELCQLELYDSTMGKKQ